MIKTVIIDCDGVLTDGKVWYNQAGERMKGFHSRDIRAIRELVSHGFDVFIYTQSNWPGLKDFAKRTGADVVSQRDKNMNLPHEYIAIGDDTPDMKILKGAKRAFAPSDCDSELLTIKHLEILETKGGDACIAELVRVLSITKI